MKRKYKVLLAALLLCFAVIGFQMVGQWGKKPEPSGNMAVGVVQRDNRPLDTGQGESSISTQAAAAPQAEGKYNQEESRKMDVDTGYLSNFLGEGKRFILKKQIQQLAGGRAASAACLPYTRSDPEEMRLEFYILLDTGEILQGYYGFQSAKIQVQESSLSEEDVWALQEEEEAKLEREREEAEESERKRAEKEKRAARKAARKQRKEETEGQQEPETKQEEGK